MKLSSNATAVESPSHVDLDAILAVGHALVLGQVTAHEARIAVALLLNPDLSGLRAIERASGLCDDSVINAIPAAGESSTLLECSSRGVFAWEAEDRRPMSLGYRSSVGHKAPSLSLNTNYVQEPQGLEGTEGPEVLEGLNARRMTGFLDPSLDVWANTAGGLGDSGWVLAMTTLLRPVTYGLDELKRILRLGERQVRRVVEKLGSWARKAKEGRRVTVTVDFSLMAHEDMEPPTTGRRDRKARQHSYEADGVREMATEVGRRARSMWQDRKIEARQIREYFELIPARIHYRLEPLLKILGSDLNRWEGERALRKHLA